MKNIKHTHTFCIQWIFFLLPLWYLATTTTITPYHSHRYLLLTPCNVSLCTNANSGNHNDNEWMDGCLALYLWISDEFEVETKMKKKKIIPRVRFFFLCYWHKLLAALHLQDDNDTPRMYFLGSRISARHLLDEYEKVNDVKKTWGSVSRKSSLYQWSIFNSLQWHSVTGNTCLYVHIMRNARIQAAAFKTAVASHNIIIRMRFLFFLRSLATIPNFTHVTLVCACFCFEFIYFYWIIDKGSSSSLLYMNMYVCTYKTNVILLPEGFKLSCYFS